MHSDLSSLINFAPHDQSTPWQGDEMIDPTALETSAPTRPLTAREARVLRYSNYQRHPKPPYAYVGMITYAIHSSPDRSLTLAAIKDKLSEMFEFFRGSYDGWKDSVRHNLSHNACFVRNLVSPNPKLKGSQWTVDLTKVPSNAFKRQETNVAKSGHWAMDLHIQLGVPEIFLPSQHVPLVLNTRDDESAASDTTRDSSPFSDAGSLTTQFNHSVDSPFDEWNEHRHTSPFMSDSSVNETPSTKPKRPNHIGPIRIRRKLYSRSRRSDVMSEANKQRLMNLISECAQQANISHEDAINNLSQLCQSVDMSSPVSDPKPYPPKETSSPYPRYFPTYHPSQYAEPQFSTPPQIMPYAPRPLPYVIPSYLPPVRYSPPEIAAATDLANRLQQPPPPPSSIFGSSLYHVLEAADVLEDKLSPVDLSAGRTDTMDVDQERRLAELCGVKMEM